MQQRQNEIRERWGYNAGNWISLGAGIASTGTMGYILYQAFAAYGLYQSAGSAAQARQREN